MILDDLREIILKRKTEPLANSYVSSLFGKGKDVILKKIGEESAEVIIASKSADKEQLIHELADLWFHCMVLMAEEGISHAEIFREFEERYEKGKGSHG